MNKGVTAIHDNQEEMGPCLIFVERDGSWARCIPKDQVETAIVWAHDSHRLSNFFVNVLHVVFA
jgi:hypothetical protein